MYETGTITTIEGVDRLRSVWQRLQQHPNADIDFYLMIGEARRSVLRPHVAYVSRNGVIVCMAVGRIEESEIAIKVGYKDIWRPRARTLTVVQGGLLGDCSGNISELLLAELLNAIRRGEADMLALHALPCDCDLLESARRHARFQAAPSNRHWSMRAPKNLEELLCKIKGKHRAYIRRIPRVLEKDFPGRVVFSAFSLEEQTEKLCVDAEKIARRTYQRGLGVGFIDNPENRRRLSLAASKGWLRGYLLYIDGEPCAFWIATKYKRTLHLDCTGFDPQYQKYRLGTLVLVKMLEAIGREDVETIDFGLGDAPYKSQFGERQWLETTACIYASTVKGKSLYICQLWSSEFSFLLRAILERAKLTDKVKRLWRNRLATAEETKAPQPLGGK